MEVVFAYANLYVAWSAAFKVVHFHNKYASSETKLNCFERLGAFHTVEQ
jgi:hypothetical protein